MAVKESRFMLGHFRGQLRYKSISEWSKSLEISATAIRNHIDRGGSFQELIDLHHCDIQWGLFQRVCYA